MPEQLETLRYQPEVLRGYIAHELGHRWDRAEETLLNDLERDQVKHVAKLKNAAPEFSAEMVERQRIEEIRADYSAIQATSPETMRTAFENLASGGGHLNNDQLAAEWLGLDPNISPEQRLARLNQLTPQENTAIAEAMGKLDQKGNEKLLYRALAYQEKHDTGDHASIQDRLELVAALEKHPELLKKGTKISFDGDANIVSVEQQGKIYTPQQVAAINRDGDREVASRGGR